MYKCGTYLLYKEPMNLRSTPERHGTVLTVIPAGEVVEVTEIIDNWGKLTFDGIMGWCCISECFAQPVCACCENKCFYFEKYRELSARYEALEQRFKQIKEYLR